MTVPKLRFKDDNGNDYPAWEEKKIKDIAKIVGGGTPSTKHEEYYKGNIPWISSQDINEESIFQISKTRFITQDAIKHSSTKIIPPYSILIVSRVGTGKVAINSEQLCTSQDYTNLILCKDFNAIFIAYCIKTIMYKTKTQAQGTSIKGIPSSVLREMDFLIPSLPEQKKIADFLSAFDKRIETTQKKLATLEKLKKGFMQKIFSQQLRFKDDDGNEYPAWEEKRLGEVTVKYKGNTLSKDNLDSEGMYPCLLYGELYTTYGPIASTILSRTNKLGKGMWVSEKDDVVVPVSGETAIDISTATCIKQNGVVIGGDLLILHSSRILGDFLSYSLNYPLKLTIAKYAQGASIVHMNIDSLMKVHIKFPSLPEQQKIADFLSAFDKKIDLVRKEVDTLQTIKKGLLQQMFV